MSKACLSAAAGAALLLLAGCGDDKGPGGLSADENRRLNEAATMVEPDTIDASPDSLTIANTGGGQTGEVMVADESAAANAQ